MPLSPLIKLITKAFKFSIHRPIQRFNIYNRAKKYLGPDAKYFKPAPRAIGPMSQNSSPIEYKPVSFIEGRDDKLIERGHQLDVKKTSVMIGSPTNRNLPKLTSLDLRDPANIWNVDKTPAGRLSLAMMQEISLNQIGDPEYWTPKVIAEKYKIREEYAESLIKYLKQVRIVVSPKMAKLLDYTGRTNPSYQAAKHLVYHVEKSLRTDFDKQFDKMYLPTDELDKEVRDLIDDGGLVPAQQQFGEITRVQKLVKRPTPLRTLPINAPKEVESSRKPKVQERKRLEASTHSSGSDKIT